MISYAASLRVYEPVRAFPEPERTRWAQYVREGKGYDPVTGAEAEHEAGLLAALTLPPTGAPGEEAELAYVRIRDEAGEPGGQAFVCPSRTRLRAWQALSEFRASLPDVVAGAFVPPAVIENAENALEKWLVENPELRSHVQTTTFQVPLRWLMLVEPAERELSLGPRFGTGQAGSGGDPDAAEAAGKAAVRSCVYLTTMVEARRRAARALKVVRRSLEDGPVVSSVEGVARWLEEFHPYSLVELDYGGLVHLFSDEQLADDDSPALVARALRALEKGDTDAAGEAYEQVMAHWHDVQQFETAN